MNVNNPYAAPGANLGGTEAPADDARLAKLAVGQKLVIYAVLLYFVAAATRTVVGPFVSILLIICLVMSLIGMFKVLSTRDNHIVTKIALFALLFVPLINILVLLIINSGATKTLREAGYRVGLMGASKPKAST